MTAPGTYRACDPTPIEQFLECGVSEEGFRDAIALVKDLIGHSFRTIRINFKHIKKEYVQSDLQQYYSKNKNRIYLFLNNPTKKLVPETFLPIPDGMISTYPVVSDALCKFLSMRFAPTSKIIIDTTNSLDAILNDPSKSDEIKINEVLTKLSEPIVGVIITSYKELQKCLPMYFHKARVGSSTVGEQFVDKVQVRQTLTNLLSCGVAYKDFVANQVNVDKIEASFRKFSNSCSTFSTNTKAPSKDEFVEAVYEYVKDIAMFCDFYGVAINESLRLEHKFMLCLTQMCEAA